MKRPHVADWLEDYASGRLETRACRELEAHLLVCDVCFAAYLAHSLGDPEADEADAPA